MKNPFISVIIPAYNEEARIGVCLRSLIKQSYPRDQYEIMVVDNNSTDRTAKIARSLKVKVVEEKNQGLVFARRQGIAASKGSLVAFIDADCLAQPLWLKKMVEIYEKNEAVVGIGQQINLQPKNLFISLIEPLTNFSLRVLKILPGSHFSFRRSAYDQTGGYSLKADFSEDIYLSKKLKKFGRLVIQKKGLVIASSRRLLSVKTALPYLLKTLVSSLTIALFNISFFKLKPLK